MYKKDTNGNKETIPITSKSEITQLFKNYGIKVENCVGYDVMYVFHMAKADFYNSSITNEQNLLQ